MEDQVLMVKIFNGRRLTACMFLPMEVITDSEKINVNSLTEIPSELQVPRQSDKNHDDTIILYLFCV